MRRLPTEHEWAETHGGYPAAVHYVGPWEQPNCKCGGVHVLPNCSGSNTCREVPIAVVSAGWEVNPLNAVCAQHGAERLRANPSWNAWAYAHEVGQAASDARRCPRRRE